MDVGFPIICFSCSVQDVFLYGLFIEPLLLAFTGITDQLYREGRLLHMNLESKVTINDIAKAVGVSKTTVSRYINGHSDMMSERTRERIRAVIEMTNYQPSDIARNLKRKNTNLIGVLIADMSTPFSSVLVVSISDYLSECGYVPIFANCNDSLQKEQEMIDSLLFRGVAGFLVNTTSCNNNYLIGVASRGIPIVLCDRYINHYNFNIVTFEQDAPVFNLVRHLKEEGYTRPVLFTQCWENNSSRRRRKDAILSAIQQVYGYDATEDVYLVSFQNGLSAAAQLDALLGRLKPGDIPAIIGTNSVTTVQTYKAIKSCGLKMPEQIGLCGPEDWNWQQEMNWAQLIEPTITTIDLPVRDLGRQSAECLVHMLKGETEGAREIMLPCGLNIRESTCRLHSQGDFG